MTRWKRDSITRYGAADACLIHYAPVETPRGSTAGLLNTVARLRRNGHTPTGALAALVVGAAARMARQEARIAAWPACA